jgi:hypothetical protein
VKESFFQAIFSDDDKGGGTNFLGVDSQALAQAFDEMGFSRTELTGDGEDSG